MIRISRTAYPYHLTRGIASLLRPASSNDTSQSCGRKNYSSHSKESTSGANGAWRGVGLGLAIGAAGIAYWISRDENVAHCGSSDHWAAKVAAPKADTPEAPKEDNETECIGTQTESKDEGAASAGLPSHVPYLIVGAGTAAMAAYRAIRAKEANAKVLLVGEEEYKPYMRPPLSKDMWFTERATANENRFTTWSGKDRSIFFEKDSYYCSPSELSNSEKGGVAVATSLKVVGMDAEKKQVQLCNGSYITYDRCLIATGGKPKNLPIFSQAGSQLMDKVTLFRNINDFKRLNEITDKAKSVVVIGGGFMGSELACALGKKSKTSDMKVTQVFPEKGNMGRVLPTYLSEWTTNKVRSERVDVIGEVSVEKSRLSEDMQQVELLLSDGRELSADHVIVAVGLEPNTELAQSAGLEVDDRLGGFLVNSELEAATNIWVAGDAACFYDVKLGRRRVEHHDHAVVSGRLAGENMTGASRRFLHQSMFWSDLGPDVGYEAIGLVDSTLPTVAVFARASKADSPAAVESKTGESLRSETEQNQEASGECALHSEADKYGKGVVFYTKNKRVVGVLCWNVFNKIGIARRIINDGAEQEDFKELAKLFDLHENASIDDSAQ